MSSGSKDPSLIPAVQVAPRAPLSVQELAWAAGFYDGEGSSFARLSQENTRGRSIQARVGNTNPCVLVRFQQALGGLGKIYGPYQRRHPHRQFHEWRVCDYEGVWQFATLLMPYLSGEKSHQLASAMMDFGKPKPTIVDIHRSQTHCLRGHPLSGDNVRQVGNTRHCRACNKLRNRRSYEKRRRAITQ